MTQFRNKYVQAMLNLSTDFKKCWELEKTQLPYFALKISFFSPELLFFYVYAEQLKKIRFLHRWNCTDNLKNVAWFWQGLLSFAGQVVGVCLWYELSVVNLEFC